MDYPINDDFKKLKMMTFPIVEGFAPAAEKVFGVFVNVNHSDKNVSVENSALIRTEHHCRVFCILRAAKTESFRLLSIITAADLFTRRRRIITVCSRSIATAQIVWCFVLITETHQNIILIKFFPIAILRLSGRLKMQTE